MARLPRFAPPKPSLLGCEIVHKPVDGVGHEHEASHVSDNGVRHEHKGDEDPSLQSRRALSNGFGNALGSAVEIALLPAVFGGLGYLLDEWLGTGPFLFVGLLVFAFAGMLVRTWLGYDSEMRRHENDLAWNRRRDGGSSA